MHQPATVGIRHARVQRRLFVRRFLVLRCLASSLALAVAVVQVVKLPS